MGAREACSGIIGNCLRKYRSAREKFMRLR